jgi:hypothetical protein
MKGAYVSESFSCSLQCERRFESESVVKQYNRLSCAHTMTYGVELELLSAKVDRAIIFVHNSLNSSRTRSRGTAGEGTSTSDEREEDGGGLHGATISFFDNDTRRRWALTLAADS